MNDYEFECNLSGETVSLVFCETICEKHYVCDAWVKAYKEFENFQDDMI